MTVHAACEARQEELTGHIGRVAMELVAMKARAEAAEARIAELETGFVEVGNMLDAARTEVVAAQAREQALRDALLRHYCPRSRERA